MWVADWYNFIIQHNPTPPGFENGKGNAYENPLRDKKHGRIYRIVYTGDTAADPDRNGLHWLLTDERGTTHAISIPPPLFSERRFQLRSSRPAQTGEH